MNDLDPKREEDMDKLERESAVDLLGRESSTVFYVNKSTADEKLCGWLFKLGNGEKQNIQKTYRNMHIYIFAVFVYLTT